MWRIDQIASGSLHVKSIVHQSECRVSRRITQAFDRQSITFPDIDSRACAQACFVATLYLFYVTLMLAED
jgi:hypothetical protein